MLPNKMIFEILTEENINQLTKLSLELWNDSTYDDEYTNWYSIVYSKTDFCLLAKKGLDYIGFIHISIRTDYVEGCENMPICYLEALYVNEKYRNRGMAKMLLDNAELWTKLKGMTQLASDTELDNETSKLFHLKAGFNEVNRIVCYVKNIQ